MQFRTPIILIAVFIIPINARSKVIQWFDEELVGSIVLLEKEVNRKFIPHGTGFLIYNYETPSNPILVTCAHVLKRSEIYVTVTADSELIRYAKAKNINEFFINESTWILHGNQLKLKVNLKKDISYVTHKSIDIAALPIGLATRYGELGLSKTKTIPKHRIQKSETNSLLGDEVYFVGFPFGIGTEDILQPLVRSGSIAWLSKESSIFLLDAFSNPGNSGSPVFTKKSLSKPESYLIGMVIGHIPEPIELPVGKGGCAKSKTFIQQNIGLARCVWVNDIMTVVRLAQEL